MKKLLLLFIIFCSAETFAQSNDLNGFNLDVLDSCLLQLDSSYHVLSFQFINGKYPEFESAVIEKFKSLDYIDRFIYDYSSDSYASLDKVKGMSITIYYESASLVMRSGEFSIDPLSLQQSQMVTNEDIYLCWTFKSGEAIRTCEYSVH